jgi:DNA-binding transcriptional LysR family regulator
MSQVTPRLMLKPNQLRLILEIAESGQLQIAAQAIGMTQPAASRMLAETERQLGAELFSRQPKGLVPTEIGASVLRRAKVILREMGSVAHELQTMRDGLGGSLHIGAVTGPAVQHLVTAVREIKEEAPTASITVDVLPSRDLLTHLVAGEMDFVLARILPEFNSRDFNIIPLQDEKVALMARADHPLARAPIVTLAELQTQEWIMQPRISPISEASLLAFASFGLNEPSNIVFSSSMLFTLAYLAQSEAIAPLSQEVADFLARPPMQVGFTALPIANEIRVSRFYLLSLRRRPLSPLAIRLREKLLSRRIADPQWSS